VAPFTAGLGEQQGQQFVLVPPSTISESELVPDDCLENALSAQ
jgi:hypothetical protein